MSQSNSVRTQTYPVSPQFINRWSSRAFDVTRKISESDLRSLFEAARWTPSSTNEQPWKFYFPKDAFAREKFNAFVNETNRTWATHASHIVAVTARKNFASSGAPNIHSWYDTGAAVMALVLEAQARGMIARQMAGILRDVIVRELAIDTSAEDIICCIAVGYPGSAEHLTERHRAQEQPNARKEQNEFVVEV